MADNVLHATITADGSGLTKTLAELEKQLRAFQDGFKKAGATSGDAFTAAGKGAEQAVPKVEKLRKKSKETSDTLDKGAKSTDNAAFALTNLGRVAQDAPFGFVGIQNNLNPLLESFQRLKASTGSNVSALKALGSSLVGPAGLGFALSAVSSLFLVFGDRLFGASAAEKALDESTQKLASTLAKDLVSLTTVVGLIKNVTTSTEDRQKALKFLNEQYDGYLKNIGIEEVTLSNLTKAYDALVDSMLRQAVVKGLQEQIAAEVEKTAQSIVKLSIAQETDRQAREKATAAYLTDEQRKKKAAEQNLKLGIQMSQQYAQGARDGQIAQQGFNDEQTRSLAIGEDYEFRIKRLKEQLLQSLAPALNLVNKFSDLGEVLKGPKSEKDDLLARAQKLSEYLSQRTIREFPLFELSPYATDEEKAALKAKAADFLKIFTQSQADIADYIRSRPIQANIGFELGDELNIDNTKFREDLLKGLPRIKAGVEKEIADYTKTNPILFQFNAALKGFYEFEELMKKRAQEFTRDIQNAFQGAFTGLADALGQAFAGESIGQALFGVIGDLLQQIGRALIQFGGITDIVKKILKNPLFGKPGFAIAAGITAIALGGLIKATQVKGQRALGGSVTAGSPYLVGERGREVFVPNTSGRIVPNSALASGIVGSGGAIEVVGSWRISGNDLIGSIANASRSQRRLS